MSIIRLLAIVTIVTYCCETARLSKEQKMEVNSRLKRVASDSSNYYPISGKLDYKVNYARGSGSSVFRNDIIMTERKVKEVFDGKIGRARTKRQVLKDDGESNSTWTDGVFYTFNTSDPLVRKLFSMAMKVWSDATCIDFVEDKNAQDKVVVVKEPEPFSDVGRLGGDQLLSVGEDNPTEGSAAHEIGHVLGFFHTMSRYDRDSFINIIVQNVDPDLIDEFRKLNMDQIEVYGLTYDYGSIMHYGELSCSVNHQPTMMAKNPRYQKTMGSDIISFSDIYMINERYGCNERCNKSTSAKCVNEGYPHPRNCSICICPSGYGGELCDRRPSGCGEVLEATREKQTLVYKLGSGSGLRDRFDFCHYMIMAPEGKKIEVEVYRISSRYDNGGCPRGGIEVKAQKDQKLTGYRFCTTAGSGGPILSNSNHVPVILFNRLSSLKANLTYRYVD